MFSLFVATLIIQQVVCISRDDILELYQPTLQRLGNLVDSKYQEADRNHEILSTQIGQYHDYLKNLTQTGIKYSKDALSASISSQSISNSATKSCLKKNEEELLKLNTSNLDSCLINSNIAALNGVLQSFKILSREAYGTVGACEFLNRLESQIQSFKRCLSDKIPDLNQQINLVDKSFDKLSGVTLDYTNKCLNDNAGTISARLSKIDFQSKGCLA